MDFLFNKTKIVATVGPASHDAPTLEQLVRAGVNVFRLNFSHGDHDGHRQVIERIRQLNRTLGTNVAILQDLQGPKIRTDEIENGAVEIVAGDRVVISTRKVLGTSSHISTSYQELPNDVRKGDTILIDDGNLELQVVSTDGEEVVTEVKHGGTLKSRKGINLPNTPISAPSLTEKDRADLTFGLEHEVDWVALSFVRTADDIREVKDIIRAQSSKTKVIAKIEKPQAVEAIDEIIAVTDGIMVARGDLGVEIPMERVPLVQKSLVQKCNWAAKPVIIATQMLESMVQNPRPTRAESADVANAVVDGADAVMLSAETAAGDYPVLAVKAMSRVIAAVEKEVDIYHKYLTDLDPDSETLHNDSVLASGCTLARSVSARAICTVTRTGYSAARVVRHRPRAQIYIFTRYQHLLTQLNLLWGVRTIRYAIGESTDEMTEELGALLVDKGYLKTGDVFINTASIPIVRKGRANMVKLSVVE